MDVGGYCCCIAYGLLLHMGACMGCCICRCCIGIGICMCMCMCGMAAAWKGERYCIGMMGPEGKVCMVLRLVAGACSMWMGDEISFLKLELRSVDWSRDEDGIESMLLGRFVGLFNGLSS